MRLLPIQFTLDNPRPRSRVSEGGHFGGLRKSDVIRPRLTPKEALNQARVVSLSFPSFVGKCDPAVSWMHLSVAPGLCRPTPSRLPNSAGEPLQGRKIVLHEEESRRADCGLHWTRPHANSSIGRQRQRRFMSPVQLLPFSETRGGSAGAGASLPRL